MFFILLLHFFFFFKFCVLHRSNREERVDTRADLATATSCYSCLGFKNELLITAN